MLKRPYIEVLATPVWWPRYVGDHNSLTLQWRHNGRDDVSNHQSPDCLLNLLFGRRLKKTSKLRVTGLCAGNSPVTGYFPAHIASNADKMFRFDGVIMIAFQNMHDIHYGKHNMKHLFAFPVSIAVTWTNVEMFVLGNVFLTFLTIETMQVVVLRYCGEQSPFFLHTQYHGCW